ncbi:hypothetical protein V4890_05430 [Ralstonia solanacearum species complex bacterium KE056]
MVQFEISKPTDDSAFEDMCARIYSEVLNDPLPKINGRRGQAQAGIDVFVSSAQGRVGIQCKRYVDGALKLRDVQAEVRRADDAKAPVIRLLVATTAVSDAKLLRQVQELSDQRTASNKFSVEIEFWEDLCRHIRANGKLQRDYAPNAPGAMFHRMEESNLALGVAVANIGSKLDLMTGLPAGRADSVDKFISAQLDAVNDLLMACRFRDALEAVNRLGSDMRLFDAHQQARWYLQRGICAWHMTDDESASRDFLTAVELYPADAKIAAAGVRGLLLRGDVAAALEAGAEAWRNFPASAYVWMAYTNARVASGQHFTLADAPVGMETNSDILQLLAWSRREAGDLSGANELIGKALNQPEAGFFVRSMALSLALEAVSADPVSCAFDLVSPERLAPLQRAIDSLSPRKERIWTVQSSAALPDTVANLGYALLLVGSSDDALQLVSEAQLTDALTPELMRVALEAYRRLNREGDILVQGRAWLSQLKEPALVLVAEVAADVGDADLVSALTAAAKRLSLDEPETPNIMTTMRWLALWRSKDCRDQVVGEILKADLAQSTSLPLICGGARILHLAGEEEARESAVSRAVVLVADAGSGPSTLLVADLLYSVGKFSQATKYYERFATRGMNSVLHTRLLRCYVLGGARLKARDLLKVLPGDWAADDEVRALALEVGRQAGDWEFLVPLAQIQSERSPLGAGGWLLRLFLDLKTRKMHRFHQTLEAVPTNLEGPNQQLAQVATLELKYDRKRSGMQRLYRLFRWSLDDLEAASGYFIGILSASGDLPFMEDSMTSVVGGSTVQLEDEFGVAITVSIDPADMDGAPSREGFYSPGDTDVGGLLGSVVGDLVELPAAFYSKRKFYVRGISSVYRYLLKVAQGKFQTSLSGDGLVASVPMPTTSEGPDFSHIHAMLKQQNEHASRSFDAYAKGPLTLGILGRLLGRSVVDLIVGWPAEEVSLLVSNGTTDDRNQTDQLLQREGAAYVVDAVTIAELVLMGCQGTLALLPRVYCSTATLEVLEVRLDRAKSDKSHGQVYDDGGVMRYVEITERDIARRAETYQSMVDAVRAHCEVVPAYGPHAPSAELQQAGEVLATEEYSAVLLAAERDATMLTVDGRLAQFAGAIFGKPSVPPQALALLAARSHLIAVQTYSRGVAYQFLGNRNFISISAYDLVLMSFQGSHVLRTAIQRLKECLSNPSTDLPSTLNVAFAFLRLRVVQPTQFKAFLELFSHVVEAVLRHPNCDVSELAQYSAQLTGDICVMAAGLASPYPPLEALRQAKLRVIGNGMQGAFVLAQEVASRPATRRAIKLTSVMCMNPPWLGFDGEVTDQQAAEIETTGRGNEPTPGTEATKANMPTGSSVAYMVNSEQLDTEVAPLPAGPPPVPPTNVSPDPAASLSATTMLPSAPKDGSAPR